MNPSSNVEVVGLSWPALLKWFGALLAAQWIEIPSPVHFLFYFMAADYVSGLIAGGIRGEIESGKAWRGLLKKVLVLILLMTIYVTENETHVGHSLTSGVAGAYIVNEIISILENAARGGIPIPPNWIAFLKSVQKLRGARPEELKGE